MESKKVSIIIPIYNCEQYLTRSLESIINQTYKNIEIICINDGSKDDSKKILMNYKNKDRRIKIINKINSGVSSARNDGIVHSTGDIITFIDADDWIDIDYIENIVTFYVEHNCDMLKSNFIIEDNGNEKDVYSYSNLYKKIDNDEMLRILSCDHYFNSVWGTFYDANIIKENNIKFEDGIIYAEDLLFQVKAYSKFKNFYWINLPKYHYFINENGACIRKNKEHLIKKCKDTYKVYSYVYSIGNYNDTLFEKMFPIIIRNINYILNNYNIRYKEFLEYIYEIFDDKNKYKITLKQLKNIKLNSKEKICMYLLVKRKYLLYYMMFKIKKIGG